MVEYRGVQAIDEMMNTCTLEQARAAKQKAVEVLRTLVPGAGIGITRVEQVQRTFAVAARPLADAPRPWVGLTAASAGINRGLRPGGL